MVGIITINRILENDRFFTIFLALNTPLSHRILKSNSLLGVVPSHGNTIRPYSSPSSCSCGNNNIVYCTPKYSLTLDSMGTNVQKRHLRTLSDWSVEWSFTKWRLLFNHKYKWDVNHQICIFLHWCTITSIWNLIRIWKTFAWPYNFTKRGVFGSIKLAYTRKCMYKAQERECHGYVRGIDSSSDSTIFIFDFFFLLFYFVIVSPF